MIAISPSDILTNTIGNFLGASILALIIWLLGNFIFRIPNLNGSWKFTILTNQTAYHRFKNLKLTYKVFIYQTGKLIYGTGEKILEKEQDRELKEYTGKYRSRIEINGGIRKYYIPFKRSKVTLHIVEEGEERKSSSLHVLTNYRKHLKGEFYSTIADQSGTVKWIKQIHFKSRLVNKFLSRIINNLATILYTKDYKNLKIQLDLTYNIFKKNLENVISKSLVDCLILAEDKRFFKHRGIDFIAIIRAIKNNILTNTLQGGSTIEQQLTRKLLRLYSRTYRRKIKEVLLASTVDYVLPKKDIPAVYLTTAYFGWKMNGIIETCKTLNLQINNIRPFHAASIIARLRYPEPQNCSLERKNKILNRTNHILALLQ